MWYSISRNERVASFVFRRPIVRILPHETEKILGGLEVGVLLYLRTVYCVTIFKFDDRLYLVYAANSAFPTTQTTPACQPIQIAARRPTDRIDALRPDARPTAPTPPENLQVQPAANQSPSTTMTTSSPSRWQVVVEVAHQRAFLHWRPFKAGYQSLIFAHAENPVANSLHRE